jgi:hypothetical protein
VDDETWNEKIWQSIEADERSQRMMRLHDALVPLATEANLIGAGAVADQLFALERETFRLAALAQQHAGALQADLQAARDAGEAPS